MIERNAGLPPERRIEFRIGVHIGDVVEEGDGDLMGDGVNIAARLECLAKSGALRLSEDAYRQVKGRLDRTVSDLGATQLKNIAEPVRVYSLEIGKSAPTKPTRPMLSKDVLLGDGIVALIVIAAGAAWSFRGGLTPSPSAQPQTASAPAVAAPPLSIVVMPFANLGGDPSQQYLADVLTEALTSSLERLPGFLVIARSTAFTYMGKPADVKHVGKELAVRYALEGSEQHGDDKVRVNAQLIDAETGTHLWADQFDEDRSDLLQMQDDIVTRVARSLHFELVTIDAARLTRSHPDTVGADDLSLRCRAANFNSEARPDGLRVTARLCRPTTATLGCSARFRLSVALASWRRRVPIRRQTSPKPTILCRVRLRSSQTTSLPTSQKATSCWDVSARKKRLPKASAVSHSTQLHGYLRAFVPSEQLLAGLPQIPDSDRRTAVHVHTRNGRRQRSRRIQEVL